MQMIQTAQISRGKPWARARAFRRAMYGPPPSRYGAVEAWVPGVKVKSRLAMERVRNTTGAVRTMYRKGETAVLLRRPNNGKVEVLFARVFAAKSGYPMPDRFDLRHAYLGPEYVEIVHPFAPKPFADSKLLYAIAEMRDRDPKLYAKQLHERLQDGTPDAPTLAAVKKCLSQWNILRGCLLVYMRGAHELLNHIAGFLEKDDLLSLMTTCKSIHSTLEEVKLQRLPLKIRLVRKSFGLDAEDWDSDLYGTTDDETDEDEPAEGQQQQQDHSWDDFGGAPDDTPSSPEIS